jgi:hypothetical protein
MIHSPSRGHLQLVGGTPSVLVCRLQQLNYLCTGVFTTICNQYIYNAGGAEHTTLLLSLPTYLGMMAVVLLPESRVSYFDASGIPGSPAARREKTRIPPAKNPEASIHIRPSHCNGIPASTRTCSFFCIRKLHCDVGTKFWSFGFPVIPTEFLCHRGSRLPWQPRARYFVDCLDHDACSKTSPSMSII